METKMDELRENAVAWRYMDGNGYNANWQYDHGDPREWRGAVSACEPLYSEATVVALIERLQRAEKALEEAREHIEGFCAIVEHCSVTDGSCCCGEDMARHSNPMDCGHSPIDHGSYAADNAHRAAKDFLTTLSGATS